VLPEDGKGGKEILAPVVNGRIRAPTLRPLSMTKTKRIIGKKLLANHTAGTLTARREIT